MVKTNKKNEKVLNLVYSNCLFEEFEFKKKKKKKTAKPHHARVNGQPRNDAWYVYE